ncbi:hypothetical protein ISG33_15330 [Glaciecola sp. MH2013]|uniref:hypothetical protein n=1 Tax=Glaciecola sp. MH2013 TaxID=2785524 RepID=UPI00189DFD85|nr:hypothetical protein [Glaciecola sp. MH2013]MBF7074773.1 hypothetical protein [Glaciecola sp. MH2013]
MTDHKTTNKTDDDVDEFKEVHNKSKARKKSQYQSQVLLAKRELLLQAKTKQRQSYHWSEALSRWFSYSKGLSATAAVGLLVIVVWYGQIHVFSPNDHNNLANHYTNVEFTRVDSHELQSESQLVGANFRIKYDKAYKDYLRSKGVIAAHHQSSAKLRMSKSGWELATCDNELIKVSDELLSLLDDIERIDSDLKVGETVDIMYAMDGRIMQILRSNEVLRC